ncbi:MAG: hypothetical protein GY828_07800 [Candidatus Gracilibacteria bacterium]|nr:hypothetical protein [Candidatus Gracilibacteria bacterium]MCP4524094.1 hypothetical protein [Candidatus Gracilibacteria bacterium]
MKPIIPLTAIIVYLLMILGIYFNIIPDPLIIIEYIKSIDGNVIYLIMFFIILLESIVYLGLYLPGQFIAVLLVVSYAKGLHDIVYLTIISIFAVTIGAFINYYLGYFLSSNSRKQSKIDYKKLFLSLIHINTIALFIFDQGTKKSPSKIVYLTGLLNLPYYFLIIMVTFLLQDEIIMVSEKSYIVFSLLLIWLIYSLFNNKKEN